MRLPISSASSTSLPRRLLNQWRLFSNQNGRFLDFLVSFPTFPDQNCWLFLDDRVRATARTTHFRRAVRAAAKVSRHNTGSRTNCGCSGTILVSFPAAPKPELVASRRSCPSSRKHSTCPCRCMACEAQASSRSRYRLARTWQA